MCPGMWQQWGGGRSRECERYARKMALIDFNDEEEKKAVRHVFESALDVCPPLPLPRNPTRRRSAEPKRLVKGAEG